MKLAEMIALSVVIGGFAAGIFLFVLNLFTDIKDNSDLIYHGIVWVVCAGISFFVLHKRGRLF
jgi:hypothetical protein